MLGQIADHCRIVNPTPTDSYVEQRRAAVAKLISDDSLSVETIEALVEFAAFGVPSKRDARHEDAANVLVEAIQEFQPSFAADVDANHLDLRLVSSIVVGERLRADPTESVNVYMASLVLSALLLQSLPQERYVARLIEDLVKLAKGSLERASKELRERRPWPSVEIAGSDAPALAKSANSAFQALLDTMARNAKADREELDMLWWVFGGRSARTGERFASMPDGERALLSAVELSERMLMPPIPTAQHFLGLLVPDEAQVSLVALVEQLRKDTLTAFVKARDGIDTVLESHPALLPLSWLADRLLASDLSPGWQPEFEKKTKLKADSAAVLGDWARQVLAECIAQRLALALMQDSEK